MAVVTLPPIIVADIDTVMETYDQIKVYRSTTGVMGPYAEITDANTRILLVEGQIAYAYTDEAGDDTYWYRTTFFHSVTTDESLPSDAQQGPGDAALDVMSVSDLLTNYLYGLPLVDTDGNAFPTSIFQHYIRTAVAYVEQRLDLPLRPKVESDAQPETADFIRQDYRKYISLQMKSYPIISVASVRLVLPTNQQVIEYDRSWIHPDYDSGLIQLVPGSGQLLLGASGAWLPLLYGWTDFLPDVYHVAYTSGFLRGTVPPDLVHLVGMVASLGPLALAGDLVLGPGIAAESVGLDQLVTDVKAARSPTSGAFGARILMYQRQIDSMIKDLRRNYKRIGMVLG